ncbi:hypothetical protein XA26_10940 [Mycolicibacterium fortuitum]|uniref:Uncharacterized protein n=1 Tax=Mycolicibacterium fortuitum TaxID=1766 RepID=A0A0N9Y6W4_MYCFO|nr:hypothetical protein XA26_10940 [Mycolicibacterium fortuitum]
MLGTLEELDRLDKRPAVTTESQLRCPAVRTSSPRAAAR